MVLSAPGLKEVEIKIKGKRMRKTIPCALHKKTVLKSG